ncbi:MAG: hypothetical protein KC502_13720 [Myxococcales bacterium]|nr:hypothetical protein [Myxococcales bacterium]
MHLMRSLSLVALASCLLFASACGTESTESTEPAEDTPAGAITYNEHIAPIFVRACDSCHTKGGIAPMALDNAKDAKKWGLAIKASVTNRTMPPWLVTADGSCGDYKDAEWLTDDEIALVGKWVDGGLWMGDPKKAPAKPGAPATLAAQVKAGTAIELSMKADYAPFDSKGTGGIGFDDYRCFPIDTKLDKDVFVTATEVVPGDGEIVHHVLLFSVNPLTFPVDAPSFGTNENVMKDLQTKNSKREGWPCYAAAGKGVLMDSLLLAWAPGEGVNHYPKGTGLRLPKGNILVMQVHYNVLKKDPKDRTRVRLQLNEKVEREAWMALHDPFLFSSFGKTPKTLKPGLKESLTTWSAKPAHLGFWVPSDKTKDLEVLGVYPHMHKLGKKMTMRHKTQAGADTCITDVPSWDFNWQRMYYFKEPLRFTKGDTLDTVCTFDTSGLSDPVKAGFGTSDEMCLMGLYVTTPKK